MLAMMSNPITINTFVVFLRLYWFEKKFQNVVQEARSRRVTLTKSRSKAKGPDNLDPELGVNGRRITVMRDTNRNRVANDGVLLDDFNNGFDEDPKANGAVGNGHAVQPNGQPNGNAAPQRDHPQIKFADEVRRSDAIQDDDEEIDPHLPSMPDYDMTWQ